MRFPRTSVPLISAIFVLVCLAPSFADTQAPITDYSKLQDVDWSGLSEAQKKIALRVMNTNGCNCRCPLNIHQYARQAAVASMAAHQQGKFWQLHDKLFQNFSAVNEENIKKWAKDVGLNMGTFEKDMQLGTFEPAVSKDLADGAAAQVM